MKPRYQATRAAIELIKRFEGFRATSAQLPGGGWTIGYGHTRTAREGVSISEADAEALLIYDTAAVVTALNEWVYSPLGQNQFDALVAFAFSIGLPNFRRSSVLRRLNEGAYLQAACAMEMWRTADFEGERIVIDALVRRRSAEMALFLTPQDGYIPVPSMVVPPRVDEHIALTAPLASTHVETPMEGAIAAMVLRAGEEPAPPAAARAAMGSLSDRLKALLVDAPIAEPEPAVAAAAEPEFVQKAAVLAEPEPVEDPDPLYPPAHRAAPDPGAPTAGEDDDDGFRHISLGTHPVVQPLVFRGRPAGSMSLRRKGGQASGPMLALMGVAGLGIAGGGVFWGVNADAAERLAGLPAPEVAGLGVSLAGIAMLGTSVYLLLRRMAARDD